MSHAYLQYACNFYAKFYIDCLKTLVGVNYANMLPYFDAQSHNYPSQKCRNFVKNAVIL